MVVINYYRKKPPAVQVLHDYDKLYEGSLTFASATSEDSIREEIAQLMQEKVTCMILLQLNQMILSLSSVLTNV